MAAKTFGDSLSAAYDGATELAFDMKPGRQYRLWCSTDAWIRLVVPTVGVAAVNGAGSHPVKAGVAELVSALGPATHVSVIKAITAGEITVSEIIDSIQS